jgi:hypothetical protein
VFHSRAAVLFTFAALVVALVGSIVRLANQSPTEPPAIAINHPVISPQLTIVGEMFVNADWFDVIFRGSRREGEPAPPPSLHPRGDDGRPGRNEGGTYRTLCVRLCDGFYFPVSFSTPRERFARDAKQCEQSCPSRSRLFVHRNPGESADDMVDLAGRPYRKLPTAFFMRGPGPKCRSKRKPPSTASKKTSRSLRRVGIVACSLAADHWLSASARAVC